MIKQALHANINGNIDKIIQFERIFKSYFLKLKILAFLMEKLKKLGLFYIIYPKRKNNKEIEEKNEEEKKGGRL